MLGREGLCSVVTILGPVALLPMPAAAPGGARANGAVANPLAAFFGATIPPDGISPAELQERGRGLHGPVPYGPKGKQALLARKVHKHRRPELGHARRGTIKTTGHRLFCSQMRAT